MVNVTEQWMLLNEKNVWWSISQIVIFDENCKIRAKNGNIDAISGRLSQPVVFSVYCKISSQIWQ